MGDWINDFYGGSIYNPFNKNTAIDKKQLIYRIYTKVITELCTTRFKWEGLPEEIDERFLEMTLYYQGLSVFHYNEEYGKFMALRGAPAGVIDSNDNATMFTVTGNYMLGYEVSSKDCVPIWSNYLRYPDHEIVSTYASRLSEMDISFDMAVVNSRQPVVMVGNEAMKLSLANFYKNLQNGEPFIGTFKGMGAINEQMSAINMGVDTSSLDQIQVAKTRVWNECMSLFGINNANQDKKERLVADEVAANDSQVSHFRNVVMKPRQQAAEQINNMFGLNVSVHWDESEVTGMASDNVESGDNEWENSPSE